MKRKHPSEPTSGLVKKPKSTANVFDRLADVLLRTITTFLSIPDMAAFRVSSSSLYESSCVWQTILQQARVPEHVAEGLRWKHPDHFHQITTLTQVSSLTLNKQPVMNILTGDSHHNLSMTRLVIETFPRRLKTLTFCAIDEDEHVGRIQLPSTLIHIDAEELSEHVFNRLSFPPLLITLTLPYCLPHGFDFKRLPAHLKKLYLDASHAPLKDEELPLKLELLSLTSDGMLPFVPHFNFPSTLTTLDISYLDCKQCPPKYIPDSVLYLTLYDMTNASCLGRILPPRLIALDLGLTFREGLSIFDFPQTLERLLLPRSYPEELWAGVMIMAKISHPTLTILRC